MSLVLLSHAAATWFMVGLIWTIQVVHYPLFALVGANSFASYEAAHTRRIGSLLVLPAITEVVTGAALLWSRPPAVPLALVLAGGVLLVILWVTTALVQVPTHRALGDSWTPEAGSRLVASNWARTIGWTLRGVLVAAMIALAL